MASIFRRDDNYVEQPKRNTVDFSFQNNMTTNFGSLRPCFCTPVMPGDSFRIKPTFGLKFLPMVFPVQTRMKASIHYFYVRNRNLWKDWPDFIGKTKEGLVPPYLHLTEQNRKQIETCQLGDFLGLPTRIYGYSYDSSDVANHSIRIGYPTGQGEFNSDAFMQLQSGYQTPTEGTLLNDWCPPRTTTNVAGFKVIPFIMSFGAVSERLNMHLKFNGWPEESVPSQMSIAFVSYDLKVISVIDKYEVNGYEASIPISDAISSISGREQVYVLVWNNVSSYYYNDMSVDVSLEYSIADGIDVSELTLAQLPWRSDENPNGIPLSVLPFRAYEAIYNVFYRNAENNPLIINGVPEYNKWNRSLEGGADNNFYPIHYHNWEDDFLTTAVPSPQQGNAPLVGLSGISTVTIGHDDGTTTEMTLDVAEDGSVIGARAVSGDEATQAALVEAVQYGISINDFRNVNSFQRWLENNIRRGYKYKDQIKTHYGVSVRYDELDMPEFIGGTSQPVLVNQISQTTPTEFEPLGAMAGQASSVGQGSEITHYCDEHGFIIGILCVKPVANYSQLLPKYFNVTDTFDYYFPEFGHIGMQPITYSEVTPLQANLEGKLNDVFGYQRAWYDLIAKTDEVHGLFRSDFRNFLINRTFDGTPELGKEFTVIDPNQVNDVFAYTENTDKILGQIYMEISKKTPIPLYGIPKLE